MKRPGLSPVIVAATLFIAASPAAWPQGEPSRSAKSVSRADDLLKRFDKNGDGKLDENELADAHEVMLQEQMAQRAAVAGLPRAPQIQAEMLEKFDKNHDGRLDDEERAEMQRAMQERRGPMAQPPAAMREYLLRQFDRNADGKIDAAEMAELEKVTRPRMESNPEQMQRLDRNGNGRLDDAEWALAREGLVRMLNGLETPRTESGPHPEQAKLDAIAAEVAKRKAERQKRAQETAAPKP